ncbi:hypothetical protein JW711_01105 [Candidatus Woesearchaeota archaeon]|nr:hypothetical protein [Candidatus Woesearchaeota archaeon]
MKNKAMLVMAIALTALLSIGFASAIVSSPMPGSYGSYPVNPSISGVQYAYNSQPVRIGGFYGQNSAFLIGLKPGVYYGPAMNTRTRYAIASQYYPRIGGWFGSGVYGATSLRSGTFVYYGGSNYQVPNYYAH